MALQSRLIVDLGVMAMSGTLYSPDLQDCSLSTRKKLNVIARTTFGGGLTPLHWIPLVYTKPHRLGISYFKDFFNVSNKLMVSSFTLKAILRRRGKLYCCRYCVKSKWLEVNFRKM